MTQRRGAILGNRSKKGLETLCYRIVGGGGGRALSRPLVRMWIYHCRTRGKCDTRSAVTFLAAAHHRMRQMPVLESAMVESLALDHRRKHVPGAHVVIVGTLPLTHTPIGRYQSSCYSAFQAVNYRQPSFSSCRRPPRSGMHCVTIVVSASSSVDSFRHQLQNFYVTVILLLSL